MLIKAPMLPASLTETELSSLVAEQSFEGCSITSIDAMGVRADNLSFDECELKKPLFSQAKLEKLQLRDVKITGGDFTATYASDGGYLRVIFNDVRMTGFDGSRSKYKDVVFKNCKLNMANFRFAKLQNVRFEDCNMDECDFQTGELTNVSFLNCTINKLFISNTKCKRVDLRSSQVQSVTGWQSAQGIIIDSVQLMNLAPELAAELQITVSDD